MKKVLIATTNKDKYDIVSRIFKKTIFQEDEFIIEKLSDDVHIPSLKEEGSNIERARKKAINAHNFLKNDYDYIVGLDDALIIKGNIEPDIKKYINKILYENYLHDGEEYIFNRAYCIIDKNNNIYEVALNIPEIYHPLKEKIVLEDHTYPLSHVSYPIGYDKPVCKLSDEEATDYFLKYVKEGLMNLKIKKH